MAALPGLAGSGSAAGRYRGNVAVGRQPGPYGRELGACGLGACAAFFVICDRQRVQRSEIEALRAEVAASRSQS